MTLTACLAGGKLARIMECHHFRKKACPGPGAETDLKFCSLSLSLSLFLFHMVAALLMVCDSSCVQGAAIGGGRGRWLGGDNETGRRADGWKKTLTHSRSTR